MELPRHRRIQRLCAAVNMYVGTNIYKYSVVHMYMCAYAYMYIHMYWYVLLAKGKDIETEFPNEE